MVCFLLLPFISWLYIKNGVAFRQHALEELRQSIDISACNSLSINGKALTHDSLKGRVWVLINVAEIPDKNNLAEVAGTIYDQNDGSRSVRLVFCGADIQAFSSVLPAHLTQRQFVSFAPSGTFECFQDIFVQRDTFSVNRFAENAYIIDNKGLLRRGYDINETSEVRKLVQHSAILIPEYKKEKPQLVRQEGY